ncbi:MAG: Stp1/IreP family PP2C-type Ser/Thr phosphatase, partial [Acidimicrobiia bacterium]|nr:Stp1/IreP family PP2C-type Ser/Thr phosphatase [Acidimicrobiia bacterium]
HNEDGYLVDHDVGLIAVADGMGGHRGGEVASAAALEALRIAFVAGASIDEAVGVANDAVHEQSVADPNLRGMGTTLTAGSFDDEGHLVLGHVGDSRAYLARDGELERVTTDHSLVEELIQAGELTPEEAEHDPRRSMITRALGLEPGVVVDVIDVDLRDGDRLLLCSDGLTTMIGEDEIATLLADEPDAATAATRLVDEANAAGGVDNITVVVIDVGDGAPSESESESEESADVRVAEPVDQPAAVEEPRKRRWFGLRP